MHTSTSRIIHKGKILTFVENTVNVEGNELLLDQVEHPGAAAAAPVMPDGRIILIRQYRYAINDWLWEIPAGLLEPGEQPDACAQREVGEETGWSVTRVESIGSIVTSPGFSNQRIYMYVAHLGQEGATAREPVEMMSVHLRKWTEIEDILRRNELIDAKTLVALYRYAVLRPR